MDWESEKPASDWLVSQQVGGSHTNHNWWLGFFFKVAANSSAMISGAFTSNQTVYVPHKTRLALIWSILIYVLATTTYIGLSFNALTGNIPQEIAQLVALLNLDLSSN
jgi:hypothetical protein